MDVTDKKYYSAYNQSIGSGIKQSIQNFDFEKINGRLTYNIQASAVYSSNIEGNTIDLNSFMNYKMQNELKKPQKEIQEIENLIAAYEYAQNNALTEAALLHCHKIFSKTLVSTSNRGKYRKEPVGVFGREGLVYLAIEAENIEKRIQELFCDIDELLKNVSLQEEEVFYHASLIHLVFAHIHPFRDGNGRAARLIEKWFVAQKLGPMFWNLPSEKYYKDHQAEYYENINLGVNYYELNYDKCIPFLIMLPACLDR